MTAPIQFGLFSFMYYTAPDQPRGMVIPPKHYHPEEALRSTRANLDFFARADDLGFDWVCVAEHHYGTAMTPSPIVAAAAVSQRVKRAKIAVLGPNLPFTNPVRTAEELAMLDNFSGGRTIVGLLRGTPHEFLTYTANPDESRAKFEEGVTLLLKAWTEPEPFGWEGIYYRYRTIAVAPRVVQQPHPPVLVSGNSTDSLDFAAKMGLDIGFTFADPKVTAAHFARYCATAKAHGWTPSPANALYRHYCYVADTDAEAQETAQRYDFWTAFGLHQLPAPVSGPPRSTAEAIRALAQDSRHIGAGSAIDVSYPPLIGAPETLIRRIAEIADIGRVSRFDLVFAAGRLPDELAIKSLNRFAKEILPALQNRPVTAA